MRTRKDVEENYISLDHSMLEVLLDIRELLIPKEIIPPKNKGGRPKKRSV